MSVEPEIVINGVRLNEGQAMTVRVAVNNLLVDVVNNGLGDDEKGKAFAAGYRDRSNEILKLMLARSSPSGQQGGTEQLR